MTDGLKQKSHWALKEKIKRKMFRSSKRNSITLDYRAKIKINVMLLYQITDDICCDLVDNFYINREHKSL